MMEGKRVRMLGLRLDEVGTIIREDGRWYFVRPDREIPAEEFMRATVDDAPEGSLEKFEQFLQDIDCVGPRGTVGCIPFGPSDLLLLDPSPGTRVVFDEATFSGRDAVTGTPFSTGLWGGTVQKIDGSIVFLRLDAPLSMIGGLDLPDSLAAGVLNDYSLDPLVTEITKNLYRRLQRAGVDLRGRMQRGRTTNKVWYSHESGTFHPKSMEAFVLEHPMPVSDMFVRCRDVMPGTAWFDCALQGARLAVMPLDLYENPHILKALRPPGLG